MAYLIKGISEDYNPVGIIKDIGDFVINTRGYLVVFRDIIFTTRIMQLSITERERIVDNILEDAKAINRIDPDTINDFRKLIKQFLEKDIKDSGNTRGKVFEYIIYKIGPVQKEVFTSEKILVKRQCFIESEEGGKIGGEKNFDLGFHCVYMDNGELTVELLENKVNLIKELLTVDFQLRLNAKKKLEYMRTVKNTLMCCKAALVALATLSIDASNYKDILDSEGFGCIDIYTFNEIKRLLNSKRKSA